MFKVCPNCGFEWKKQLDLLEDRDVELIGYQADMLDLNTGLFYFNHSCGTTMALENIFFANLGEGPVFQERKTGSEECPGYCLRVDELKPCPAECECAYVRELVDKIGQWPKKDVKGQVGPKV